MLTEPQLLRTMAGTRRKHDSNVFIALMLNSEYSVVSDNQNHVRPLRRSTAKKVVADNYSTSVYHDDQQRKRRDGVVVRASHRSR